LDPGIGVAVREGSTARAAPGKSGDRRIVTPAHGGGRAGLEGSNVQRSVGTPDGYEMTKRLRARGLSMVGDGLVGSVRKVVPAPFVGPRAAFKLPVLAPHAPGPDPGHGIGVLLLLVGIAGSSLRRSTGLAKRNQITDERRQPPRQGARG